MLVTGIPDLPTGYTTQTGCMLYITVTIASPSQTQNIHPLVNQPASLTVKPDLTSQRNKSSQRMNQPL